ncbi:preprotein translocase subunit SecG [Pusillimonas sp. TS35]|uniref:preprotein translocase subunit SecG n=1 Tax=Paracandidimonas lactea TaxID=2895524 RepID=UPI00136DA55B|nr:preprotein translocase subunit SecG [Paracandidimonas lactea]MYN13443.1 preprotein translocase subunit SecG [Pusillimonas sp. TS35]
MQWLSSVLLAVQVISSLSIIVLVLLQQGKGADMGSSFGGGSAGSLFGASGAANFLSRTTKWAAIVFFASTAGLAWVGHRPVERSQVQEGVMQNYQGAVPASGGAVPAAPGAGQGAAVPAVPSVPQSASPAQQPAPATTTDKADAAKPEASTSQSAPAK